MNPRTLVVAGVLITGVTASVVLARTPRLPSASPLRETPQRSAVSASPETGSTGSRAPEFYPGNVRANLFARPQPPLPPAPDRTEIRPPPPPQVNIPIVLPTPDRFAGYAYTGTVSVDGEMQALLEDVRTKEGWYVHTGDAFQGATITQIENGNVTLQVNGQTRRIAKSDAYNLTPLNASSNAQPGKNITANATVGSSPSAMPQNGGLTATAQMLNEALQNSFSNSTESFYNSKIYFSTEQTVEEGLDNTVLMDFATVNKL